MGEQQTTLSGIEHSVLKALCRMRRMNDHPVTALQVTSCFHSPMPDPMALMDLPTCTKALGSLCEKGLVSSNDEGYFQTQAGEDLWSSSYKTKEIAESSRKRRMKQISDKARKDPDYLSNRPSTKQASANSTFIVNDYRTGSIPPGSDPLLIALSTWRDMGNKLPDWKPDSRGVIDTRLFDDCRCVVRLTPTGTVGFDIVDKDLNGRWELYGRKKKR